MTAVRILSLSFLVLACGAASADGNGFEEFVVDTGFRDINNDDRDDLIVPDTAGYRVRLQKSDGSLGEESLLEESSRMTVANSVVSFESLSLLMPTANRQHISCAC